MNRYDEYINENGLIVFLRKRRKIMKLRNEKPCEKRIRVTRVYIKFAF